MILAPETIVGGVGLLVVLYKQFVPTNKKSLDVLTDAVETHRRETRDTLQDQNQVLNDIRVQTTKTNGRMNAAEDRLARNETRIDRLENPVGRRSTTTTTTTRSGPRSRKSPEGRR